MHDVYPWWGRVLNTGWHAKTTTPPVRPSVARRRVILAALVSVTEGDPEGGIVIYRERARRVLFPGCRTTDNHATGSTPGGASIAPRRHRVDWRGDPEAVWSGAPWGARPARYWPWGF